MQLQTRDPSVPTDDGKGQNVGKINIRIFPGKHDDPENPPKVGDDIFDYDTDRAGNKTWPIPYWPVRDYTFLINATDVNPAFQTLVQYLPAPPGDEWPDKDIVFSLVRIPFESGLAPTRTGAVVADGRAIRDDQGNFNARGITYFTLPFMLKHFRENALQNLQWCMDKGFQFWRGWGKVGGGSWADRVIDPADPDYVSDMCAAVNTAYDKFFMRSDIALIADNFDERDPIEAAFKIVEVIRSCGVQKFLLVEGANEDNMPDEDRNLPRVVDVIRQAFPELLVVARCAPVAADPGDGHLFLNMDAYPFANAGSVHSDRSLPTERQLRQLWDVRDAKRVFGSLEPPGPWSSVAEMRDPLARAMLSFVSGICGVAIDVYHNGPGIRSGGAWDRSIPANFWEIPGGDETAAGIMHAAALLPPDIVTWQKINGQWAGHPLPAKWVWSDGFAEGVSRIYAAVRGDEFYCAVIGVQGRSPHPVLRNCRIEVFNLLTNEILEVAELRGGAIHSNQDAQDRRVITGDGDYFTFNGPEAGGLAHYAVRGRFI